MRTSCGGSSVWRGDARYRRPIARLPAKTRSHRTSSRCLSCSGTNGNCTCALRRAGAELFGAIRSLGQAMERSTEHARTRPAPHHRAAATHEAPRRRRRAHHPARRAGRLRQDDACARVDGPARPDRALVPRAPRRVRCRDRRALLSQALAPLSPTIERSTRELLSALNTPEEEPEVVADLLVEELDGWPDDTWLVIDEYELVAPHPGPVRVIERFVAGSGAKVLITGRERPDWVTPRDVLYGDAFELRGAALSMTQEEASQVLAHAGHPSAGLVALADGWPAVIGLAALLPGEVKPTSDEQPALFDYVAQELFDELDPDVQRHLVLLSVPATLTPALVQAVLGDDAERVLRDSTRVGLMSAREPNEIEIHPLCRAFLEQKIWDVGVSREQIDTLTLSLIDGEQWDDAFEAIRAFGLEDRLPLLIERGLRRVLAEGRTARRTLDRVGRRRALQTAEVALSQAGDLTCDAEIGRLVRSLRRELRRSVTSKRLIAQAHLCAGSSAQLLDEVERAWDHFGERTRGDAPPDIRRRALWGRFVASSWTKRPEYRRRLTELEETSIQARSSAAARPSEACRRGARRRHFTKLSPRTGGRAALVYVLKIPSFARGFMNTLSYALVRRSQIRRNRPSSPRQLKRRLAFSLAFAVPTALMNLAMAQTWPGSFAAAARCSSGREPGHDERSVPRCQARHRSRVYLLVSRSSADDGLELSRQSNLDNARSDIAGEAIATRAFAEACCGERIEPRDSIDAAANVVNDVKGQVLLGCARAVLALDDDARTLTDGSTSSRRP